MIEGPARCKRNAEQHSITPSQLNFAAISVEGHARNTDRMSCQRRAAAPGCCWVRFCHRHSLVCPRLPQLWLSTTVALACLQIADDSRLRETTAAKTKCCGYFVQMIRTAFVQDTPVQTGQLVEKKGWLPGMDSNHDSRLQRPLSYH